MPIITSFLLSCILIYLLRWKRKKQLYSCSRSHHDPLPGRQDLWRWNQGKILRAGVALCPCLVMWARKTPNLQQREWLTHGNRAWHSDEAREKVHMYAPGSIWQEEQRSCSQRPRFKDQLDNWNGQKVIWLALGEAFYKVPPKVR